MLSYYRRNINLRDLLVHSHLLATGERSVGGKKLGENRRLSTYRESRWLLRIAFMLFCEPDVVNSMWAKQEIPSKHVYTNIGILFDLGQ